MVSVCQAFGAGFRLLLKEKPQPSRLLASARSGQVGWGGFTIFPYNSFIPLENFSNGVHLIDTPYKTNLKYFLSAFAEDHGCKPVDECVRWTRRSLQSEGGCFGGFRRRNERYHGCKPVEAL